MYLQWLKWKKLGVLILCYMYTTVTHIEYYEILFLISESSIRLVRMGGQVNV